MKEVTAGAGTHSSGVAAELRRCRLLAILRGVPRERLAAVAEALVGEGVSCLEVTLDSEDALDGIRELDRLFPQVVIGAGTILSPADLDAAASAGARFAVSPHYDAAIVEHAVATGIEIIPGAATPTEVIAAHRAGATAVKLFPAGVLGGIAYVRALQGPIRHVPLVPTGAIDVDEVGSYLRAGAFAVALGGSLVGDAARPDGDLGALAVRARNAVRQAIAMSHLT